MKEAARHQLVWKTLTSILRWPLKKLFAYTFDTVELQQPALVVANHVTNYDPFFVAASFPQNMMYFIASEHLFRLGWVSKAINYLVAPIARRKGSKGFDAAMTALRKIRAGHSICLFAEGETTWDGVTQEIYPATAMLARASGGALVTYRIEGGYFTAPRWGKGIRCGKMHGRVVNIYQPEQLKGMKDADVIALINRDLYEDADERQQKEQVRYRSKHSAEQMEVALCMCPKCRRIGKLHSHGDRLTCECGMDVRYTEYGRFEPSEPFATVHEWNLWQQEQLEKRAFEHEGKLFSDANLTLYEILDNHQIKEMAAGELSIDDEALYLGDMRFEHAEVQDLALVVRRKMLFTYREHYYEIRAEKPLCLRKYLKIWQTAR